MPRNASQLAARIIALRTALDFLPSSKAEAKALERHIAAQEKEIAVLKAQGAAQAADITALQQQINATVPFRIPSFEIIQIQGYMPYCRYAGDYKGVLRLAWLRMRLILPHC